MNREQIITEIYNSKELKEVINKMNPQNLRDDLLSEVMLVVCQLEEGRLFKMHQEGYLKFYVIRTILNMIRSNDSSFHNKFRQIKEELKGIDIKDIDESEILEEELKSAEEFHQSLPFYENKLIESYIELENNANRLSKETGIPVRSIYHTIKMIKEKYKKRDRKKQKVKFNIECTISFPEGANTDEILDGLDLVLKSINEIKNKNFKPNY